LAFINEFKIHKILNFKIFAISITLLLFTSLIPSIADSKVAVIETKFGNMVIEFFPNDAPNTVDNFIKLAESGFYNNTKFHRIIPNFMIQGGDPFSKDNNLTALWGTGDAGYSINAEFNNIKHKRGIVSMARTADPNSASSQFFIVHKDSNHLDGKYTAFGRLVTQESYDVLDKIALLETIHDTTTGIPINTPIQYADAEIHSIKIKNISDIPNLLNLDEPDRVVTHYTLDDEGNYYNTLFGFSLKVPEGWSVQEPEKTQPEAPDVVVVGPVIDEFAPVVSFLVEDANGNSLDTHITQTKKNLQPLIDAARLQIISEENQKIKGYDSHVTEARGGFAGKDKLFIIKYQEIVFKIDNKFYTLTYTNQEKHFESSLDTFNKILDSFEPPMAPTTPPTNFPYEYGIGIAVAIAAAIFVIKRRKNYLFKKTMHSVHSIILSISSVQVFYQTSSTSSSSL
jgi:peptidyl-prolyl cis-trans isomerase B (cyclophilin B)